MSIENEIFVTFILRIIYSTQLFVCASVLFYISTLFHNKNLRRFLRGHCVWLLVLASARSVATLFDYFFDFGVGSIPLFINNLCWLYAIWFLLRFAIKLIRDKNKDGLAIHKTETSFEEVLRILENNKNKTNRLKQDLIKRL